MTIYFKTKDGKMIWVDDVVYLELNKIENGAIHDGQWTFDSTGGDDGRKDV